MRAVWPGTLLALSGLLSCTRHEGKPEASRPQAPLEEAKTAAAGSKSGAGAAPAAEPPLALMLRAEHTPDGVGLRVLNPGPERVTLAREVSLETLDGGGKGRPVHGQALELKLTCSAEGCVTLAPGGELVAPPWLGLIGAERCGALLRPVASGEYRLRVRRCKGEASAEVTFTWQAP